MKNIFKIVFLSLVGFGLLIYLTAEKPQNVNASSVNVAKATINTLPERLELVGSEKEHKKEELFKANTKTLIIVGNHDSLAIVKDLKKYFTVDMPFVLVANISNAPWFIKKWAIPGKLEELNKGTNVPMVYDTEGTFVAALNLDDTTKTKFFAYVLNENGDIVKVYEGSVKEGALDGSMNEEEKKSSLAPVIEAIK